MTPWTCTINSTSFQCVPCVSLFTLPVAFMRLCIKGSNQMNYCIIVTGCVWCVCAYGLTCDVFICVQIQERVIKTRLNENENVKTHTANANTHIHMMCTSMTDSWWQWQLSLALQPFGSWPLTEQEQVFSAWWAAGPKGTHFILCHIF